jgi:hypothetical protein
LAGFEIISKDDRRVLAERFRVRQPSRKPVTAGQRRLAGRNNERIGGRGKANSQGRYHDDKPSNQVAVRSIRFEVAAHLGSHDE